MVSQVVVTSCKEEFYNDCVSGIFKSEKMNCMFLLSVMFLTDVNLTFFFQVDD